MLTERSSDNEDSNERVSAWVCFYVSYQSSGSPTRLSVFKGGSQPAPIIDPSEAVSGSRSRILGQNLSGWNGRGQTRSPHCSERGARELSEYKGKEGSRREQKLKAEHGWRWEGVAMGVSARSRRILDYSLSLSPFLSVFFNLSDFEIDQLESLRWDRLRLSSLTQLDKSLLSNLVTIF